MKIMLDTNILISAFVFGGRTGKLLERLLESDYELLVSEYVDRELKDKLRQKFPDKADRVYQLFHQMGFVFCDSTDEILGDLRDKKDIPVLSDAIYHHADLILTGDRDFLEADLEKPLVFSPTMLWDYLRLQ